ncbi:MAG: TIGR04552 family protein [Acidobacteria bacterium]|nr:TIGR04552 family protein [Acidobacteriota bacterium]
MYLEHPFSLPPEIPRVILGGDSAIDLEGLHLGTEEEARTFALHYGYDMDSPPQRLQVVQGFEEALAFLEEVILEGTGMDIPEDISGLRDPLQLLLWASERPRSLRSRWACAVLRIMHTLFHIGHNFILRFLPEIQAQVFSAYDRHLVQREDGSWLLRGRYEVPLVAVERKQKKDRLSILLKLLHKPENVAETIYDQVGIRFVAEDRVGVLEVLRFLVDHHVTMAAHVKPSRARNLVFDLQTLSAWAEELPGDFQPAHLDAEERAALGRHLALESPRREDNPFSSKDYSAVQFTARTLIRLPNPAARTLERLQSDFAAIGKPELADLLHIPELIQSQDEFTFFFAHEVQVMEKAGFLNAREGPASHQEYKLRKREAARKRVLQGILREEVPC